jgi:hypothetical protein
MNDNLVQYFRRRADAFPFRRDIDLEHFLADALDDASATLPIPTKIFLVDELQPFGYGFAVSKAEVLDELAVKLEAWLDEEIAVRTASTTRSVSRAESLLTAYRSQLVKVARNALHSSILADYHSVFWLLHSQQVAKLFTALPRQTMNRAPEFGREHADQMKYILYSLWTQAVRLSMPEIIARNADELLPDYDESKLRFVRLLIDNPLIATEEFIRPDLRDLRVYFSGALRRDFDQCRRWMDQLRKKSAELMVKDRVFRRAVLLLGYPDAPPGLTALLDPRVQQLLLDHPSYKPEPDQAVFDLLSKRLLEYLIVYHLRRGVIWMRTTADGENVGEDGDSRVYSRALRPLNFGRRGVVEPIVYRYGLVYDITSFTQTLGEIARGGQQDEQHSYRQMLEFQRDLADITRRHGLQFEKFLGDGAFYTSRRATRTIHAAVELQRFYSAMRAKGFAFNKGMRMALNYGYYRLLPMQVSTDGTEIKEFYGPGIVELSRLTTGKATKELEDVQHLLLSHGYDQLAVWEFFSPLSRSATRNESDVQREFYAYVNENGHLMNEGIVVSIPFLKQLSTELIEDGQRVYRLSTKWASYVGIPSTTEAGTYIGIRILGSVSLKGIGSTEVGEVVRLTPDEAEVSLVDEAKPLLQLLQRERHRSAAASVAAASPSKESDVGSADLVVCQSRTDAAQVILVGEWDPVSEEVRRPIQLDDVAAERYGLAVPLTAEAVESQSMAYQKLYRKLSRLETLPSFSVQAIRDNQNFNGFIIGATVERL